MTVDRKLRAEIHQLHAEVCRALADPTRIALLYALRDGPLAVSELALQLDASPSTVSRHLRVLRTRSLVRARREGTSVYYEVADDRVLMALDTLRRVMADTLEDRGEIAAALG